MYWGFICYICRKPLKRKQNGFCQHCLKQLPELPVCCPCCGLPAGDAKRLCGHCLKDKPNWDRLICVTDYVDPLKGLIIQLKFYKNYALGYYLARLLLLKWLRVYREQQITRPDYIIPVPLSRLRFWKRGFNQSEAISRYLAHWLGGTSKPFALSRYHGRREQKQLSSSERKHNLHNAFYCKQRFDHLHIALVDDVVTTGSTVNEISMLLKKQGAASVQILCVCRNL